MRLPEAPGQILGSRLSWRFITVSPSAIPGQNPINPQVLYPIAPIFPPINLHKYNSFPLT
jgi:hypothetical protein